jgi:long-chain fatty acid transport protein
MSNIKTLALMGASVFSLSIAASQADAAGFYLQEQSVSGLGNAFAGQVATPRDSSIIYFNPAGMTHLKGTNANIGVHLVAPNADMTNNGSTQALGGVTGGDGGNPYDATPVPNGSISHETIDDTLWLGLVVSSPFGLGSDYGTEWFGRNDSTKTHLKTIEITPSFAYKVNEKLSVGGGITYQHADATLENVTTTAPNNDVFTQLKGDDHSFGWNVGVLYEPIEGTLLGAHYRSNIDHELEGFLTAPSTLLAATAELNLPNIAQFGINQRINDKWSVQAGATWFGWNSFDNITAFDLGNTQRSRTEQNYQTTWAFAVGGEYEMNDKWKFRAGYQFDETPTTDEYRTSRTPDGDRHWFAAGTTYTINEKMSLDFAATYIDVGEESIDVTRNLAAAPATVRANTDGYVGIVALGLNYKF